MVGLAEKQARNTQAQLKIIAMRHLRGGNGCSKYCPGRGCHVKLGSSFISSAGSKRLLDFQGLFDQ